VILPDVGIDVLRWDAADGGLLVEDAPTVGALSFERATKTPQLGGQVK